ncbi:MAG: hypothetical protein MUC30_06225 [Bacteroidales bacterium]|jgi:hypothetical protein|nr:hypothetical protein [Bacteroidales bacterium]
MAIPNFFKQNKPRGFNYAPRYYDPKKEEREARRTMNGEQGAGSGEQGAHSTPYRSRIMRGSMKNYFPRQREKVERHNMIRLIVIVLILVLITYFYLFF